MIELFANSGDPDQMPHSTVSDLGLHCFSFTHLGVSSPQWFKLHNSLFFLLTIPRLFLCCSSFLCMDSFICDVFLVIICTS